MFSNNNSGSKLPASRSGGPGFMSGHAGFVADKVALGQDFSENSAFPANSHYTNCFGFIIILLSPPYCLDTEAPLNNKLKTKQDDNSSYVTNSIK
jgi:hypothetical protein